jgi:hypothetical protein
MIGIDAVSVPCQPIDLKKPATVTGSGVDSEKNGLNYLMNCRWKSSSLSHSPLP